MKLGPLGVLTLVPGALFASACATDGAAPAVLTMPTVTAHVQIGPQLANLPDVPTVVGARVDGNVIHTALDRFGVWGDEPSYGAVWYPEPAPQGFVPYGTDGRWQLTDAGWYWQSQLPWGWLTFHYGRWVQVNDRWGWVPGARFAPAWVDWRITNGYAGWAPLPPEGAAYSAPYAFCPCEQLASADVWSSCAYGAASSVYYATSYPMPVSYGYGGAIYAWGPPVSMFGSTGPVPVAMPVGSAFHGETQPGPRVGVPVVASGGSAAVQPRAGGPTGMTPGGGTVAPPTTTTTTTTMPMSPYRAPTTFASGASPVGPHIATPGVEPPVSAPHGRWTAVAPSAGGYDGQGMIARYRSADTVVVSDQAAAAARNYSTISLGTTTGYAAGGGGFSGSNGAIPSAGAAPAAFAPGAGSSRPVGTGSYGGSPSYTTAPSYRPASTGYAPSSYAPSGYAPASTYAPTAPTYGAGSSGFAGAAHYNAAPSYSPSVSVPAPSYSAPSYHAPSYAPAASSSGGGGYHFGGGTVSHFGRH